MKLTLNFHIMTQKEFERRLLDLDIEKQEKDLEIGQEIEKFRIEIRNAHHYYVTTEDRITPLIKVLENKRKQNALDYLQMKGKLYRQFEDEGKEVSHN